MANKFTQSVMQQLEQQQKPKSGEATKKAQIKTGQTPEHQTEKKAPAAPEPVITQQAQPVSKPAFQVPDLSEFLRPEPTRIAKNKTFYLDAEVIDALHRTAKQQHVTDSKLANDILRRVLGIN